MKALKALARVCDLDFLRVSKTLLPDVMFVTEEKRREYASIDDMRNGNKTSFALQDTIESRRSHSYRLNLKSTNQSVGSERKPLVF